MVSAELRKFPSVSYNNLINCYPEFKDPKLQFDMDLTILKEKIDSFFPSSKSTLRFRNITIKNLKNEELRRIVIGLKRWKLSTPIFSFFVESLSKKGDSEVIRKPEEFESLVPNNILNAELLNYQILKDESVYIDTKPKSKELIIKRTNEKIIELELTDTSSKINVKCESQVNTAVLCVCLKN